jgi:3-deoxy-manno-octulosonate cytidylyltransferase (CMP-KDO synthetase)
MNRKVIVLIPARLGSKRFPRKSLCNIGGYPLIVWAYTQAKQSGYFVAVVTPDEEIRDLLTNKWQIPCIKTSEKPINGSERCYEAICSHLIPFYEEEDIILNVQGDMAMFDYSCLKRIVHLLEDPDTDFATTVCLMPYGWMSNPNRVKCSIRRRPDKWQIIANDFSRESIPGTQNYLHIGIYGFKKKSLKSFYTMIPTKREIDLGLEQMRIIDNGYEMAVDISIKVPVTIDCEEDLEYAVNQIRKQGICI